MAKRSRKDAIDPQRSIREQDETEDCWSESESTSSRPERLRVTLVDINGGPDSGRILGYDNAHGYHHRHYLGKVEPVEFNTYEEIEARFEKETQRYLKEGEIQKKRPPSASASKQ
jgi:hypothetical protein